MNQRQMYNSNILSMSDDSEKLKLWNSLHNIPMISLENLFLKEITYFFSYTWGESL